MPTAPICRCVPVTHVGWATLAAALCLAWADTAQPASVVPHTSSLLKQVRGKYNIAGVEVAVVTNGQICDRAAIAALPPRSAIFPLLFVDAAGVPTWKHRVQEFWIEHIHSDELSERRSNTATSVPYEAQSGSVTCRGEFGAGPQENASALANRQSIA